MLIDRLCKFSGIAAVALFLASPASALTMAECSAKYNAAKDAGSLDGKTWNQFRAAECGSDASAETKPAKKATKAAAGDDAEAKGLSMAECSAKYQAAKDAGTLGDTKWNDFRKAECGAGASTAAETKPAKKATKAAAGDDAEAKGLSMAECSAKYQAAKDAGTLGDTKWNDFRKAECGAGASAAAETKPAKKATRAAAGDDAEAKGLSMAECSAKYQAAKDAGTLGDTKWNDFRKAECGAGASAAVTKAAKSSDSGGAKGLTMAECSAKYQNAKAGGSLNGMKWNDFRKAQCGAGASDDDTVPSVDEASYNGEPEAPTVRAPRGVKFPATIARKFANETPGKARLHTCLEQYYANKDADALGGLRWIQKGGGYYSLCNSRLKGNV